MKYYFTLAYIIIIFCDQTDATRSNKVKGVKLVRRARHRRYLDEKTKKPTASPKHEKKEKDESGGHYQFHPDLEWLSPTASPTPEYIGPQLEWITPTTGPTTQNGKGGVKGATKGPSGTGIDYLPQTTYSPTGGVKGKEKITKAPTIKKTKSPTTKEKKTSVPSMSPVFESQTSAPTASQPSIPIPPSKPPVGTPSPNLPIPPSKPPSPPPVIPPIASPVDPPSKPPSPSPVVPPPKPPTPSPLSPPLTEPPTVASGIIVPSKPPTSPTVSAPPTAANPDVPSTPTSTQPPSPVELPVSSPSNNPIPEKPSLSPNLQPSPSDQPDGPSSVQPVEPLPTTNSLPSETTGPVGPPSDTPPSGSLPTVPSSPTVQTPSVGPPTDTPPSGSLPTAPSSPTVQTPSVGPPTDTPPSGSLPTVPSSPTAQTPSVGPSSDTPPSGSFPTVPSVGPPTDTSVTNEVITDESGNVIELKSMCKDVPEDIASSQTTVEVSFVYALFTTPNSNVQAIVEENEMELHRALVADFLTCPFADDNKRLRKLDEEAACYPYQISSVPSDAVNSAGCDESDQLAGSECNKVNAGFTTTYPEDVSEQGVINKTTPFLREWLNTISRSNPNITLTQLMEVSGETKETPDNSPDGIQKGNPSGGKIAAATILSVLAVGLAILLLALLVLRKRNRNDENPPYGKYIEDEDDLVSIGHDSDTADDSGSGQRGDDSGSGQHEDGESDSSPKHFGDNSEDRATEASLSSTNFRVRRQLEDDCPSVKFLSQHEIDDVLNDLGPPKSNISPQRDYSVTNTVNL